MESVYLRRCVDLLVSCFCSIVLLCNRASFIAEDGCLFAQDLFSFSRALVEEKVLLNEKSEVIN